MRLSIPHWLIIGLNLILATGCIRSGNTAPRIVFPQSEISAVPDHGHIRHRFKFRNEGAEILEILRVTSSCGCTTAQPGQQSLAQGEESFIEADMSVRPGRRESFVTVFTNDPTKREATLRIRVEGKFPPEFEFLPNSIHVSTPVGGTSNADVLLRLTEWKASIGRYDLEDLQLPCVSRDARLTVLRHESARLKRELFDGGAVRVSEKGWYRIDKLDRTIWLLPLQVEYRSGDERGLQQTPIVARIGSRENELTALLLFSADND